MSDQVVDLTGVQVNKLVQRYLDLRNAREALTRQYDKEYATFSGAMDVIETELLRRANEENVTGYRIEGLGTTYISQEMKCSIADDKALFDYIQQSGDLDLLQRRVSNAGVQAYMEANSGALPPGVNVFRQNRMKVRKA